MFGVSFRLLDKVLAHKTIERSDDSVAKKVTIHGCVLWFYDAGWGAEFRSFAWHSFQLVRVEQLVLCMLVD